MNPNQATIDFFTQKGPEDIERFVDKNLDISQQVYKWLDEKGWTQKDLASKLGKREAEVSKWLSGTHNLTLRSIAKLEAALGEDVILTPLKAEKRYKRIDYLKLHVHARLNTGMMQSDTDINYSGVAEFGQKTSKSKGRTAA